MNVCECKTRFETGRIDVSETIWNYDSYLCTNSTHEKFGYVMYVDLYMYLDMIRRQAADGPYCP